MKRSLRSLGGSVRRRLGFGAAHSGRAPDMWVGGERRQICVVRVRRDDRWRAEFVIDGRRFDTAEEFRRATDEAFLEINGRPIVAEFETSDVSDAEPRMRLPSWEQFRSRLGPRPEF